MGEGENKMQLLIVDDENIIIEDLKTSMDWGGFGIHNIFNANNIRQAKEIFTDNKIDIMLCDIEMPQGSGLDLLSWVRDNYSDTESIFLTCHADFRYAKEAIRLGSLDYLLKPIPYDELEKAVSKAVSKISNNNKLLETSRYGEFWFRYQPMAIERFWTDIINRAVPPDIMSIREASEQRNIHLSSEMKLIPVLFNIRRWYLDKRLQELKIIEYEIKNIVEGLLLKDGSGGLIFEIEKGKLILILSSWDTDDINFDDLETRCKECIIQFNQSHSFNLSVHIGERSFPHELADMVDRLLDKEKNNVAYENKVFTPKEKDAEPGNASMPDMNVWSIMLAEGASAKLIDEIISYLESLIDHDLLTSSRLKYFKHDFIQMVYSTLKQLGIKAHELLSDEKSSILYDNSDNSAKDLIDWIRHVVNKAAEHAAEIVQSETVVFKVKKYILANLQQRLTRDEIASQYYLNSDYLDRIFKRESGSSVTKFIMEEKLKRAKELIEKTDIPISEIASSFGFINMSHFSTAFKKITKSNPADYRKKYQK